MVGGDQLGTLREVRNIVVGLGRLAGLAVASSPTAYGS
jgi:hypothetical protein